ncbi:MAG: FHIPEP family type III secretion protein [Gammaproteobacteria bacterium]|nr:FHIPEP family type III secretion protein [Gammaproteobacteria bacterium]
MLDKLKQFTQGKNDLFLVFGMIGILVVLFTPIPPQLLDFLLIANFSFALLILLITFYTEKPLQFSTFPSLLLIATLFRLSLNIAATRLILNDADAGEVIGAVGSYVVGGNYVIGLVVFLILIVVQYVVVTNGAQRVAEVAARFTLDSMPGKQMSIDADMNMGLIDEHEAKERRSNIEKEANFYGAMDGSTKFVKGDAIAGIIIILIDIIGGLSIGIVQHGMGWGEALHTFTLLTVGDGIVTQIPSLVIAVATGIIITRAATDASLSTTLVNQIASHPKTLAIIATLLLLVMMLPGLPIWPLLILFVAFAAAAYYSYKKKNETESEKPEKTETKDEEDFTDQLTTHPLEVKLGASLADYAKHDGIILLEQIAELRKRFAKDYGFVIPEIKITDHHLLGDYEYEIYIQDFSIAKGEARTDKVLAIDPGNVKAKIEGIATHEPTYGLPAVWIEEKENDQAKRQGYTVVNASTLMVTHFTETLKRSAYKLIDRVETEAMLERLRPKYSGLIEEVIPNSFSISELQIILQALLKEGVSIKRLEVVLDAMSFYSKQNLELLDLVEKIRERLAPYIVVKLKDKSGAVNVLTLEASLEQRLLQQIKSTQEKKLLVVEPALLDSFMKGISTSCERMMSNNMLPVILCSAQLRAPLRSFIERIVPSVTVLGLGEIPDGINIKTFGNIKV